MGLSYDIRETLLERCSKRVIPETLLSYIITHNSNFINRFALYGPEKYNSFEAQCDKDERLENLMIYSSNKTKDTGYNFYNLSIKMYFHNTSRHHTDLEGASSDKDSLIYIKSKDKKEFYGFDKYIGTEITFF